MLIDGKLLAQKILEDLKKRVQKLDDTKHIQPHLGVIVVGNDPATASYVRQKKKKGEEIGGIVSIYNYPQSVSQAELEQNIDFLQNVGELQGLIIQLPLPKHLDETELTQRVRADLDVDGFREDSDFEEPIAIAVIKILEEIYTLEQSKDPKERIGYKNVSGSKYYVLRGEQKIHNTKYVIPNTSKQTSETQKKNDFATWLKTQKIVIMGKGKTGGKPIIKIMKKFGVEPIIVDSKTPNSSQITQTADILVCAVGGRGTIINESLIKKDAIVIGIGMSLGEDGKLHGDYEPEEIAEKAAYYTPVPGGVGPVNAAMLLVNVVDAAEKSAQI